MATMTKQTDLGDVVLLLHQAADLVWEDADLALGIALAAAHATDLLPPDTHPGLTTPRSGMTGSQLLQAAAELARSPAIANTPAAEDLQTELQELIEQATHRGF